MSYYLLNADHIPYKVSMMEWAIGFSMTSERIVDRTPLGNRRGFVSTVFLGLDHGFTDEPGADPVLFETMVFSNTWLEGFTRRYSFWPEAVQGHKEVVQEALKWLRENGSRNQREGRYMDRLKKRKVSVSSIP